MNSSFDTSTFVPRDARGAARLYEAGLRGITLMRVLQVCLTRRRKAGIAMLLTFGHGLDWMKLNAEQLNNRLRH